MEYFWIAVSIKSHSNFDFTIFSLIDCALYERLHLSQNSFVPATLGLHVVEVAGMSRVAIFLTGDHKGDLKDAREN